MKGWQILADGLLASIYGKIERGNPFVESCSKIEVLQRRLRNKIFSSLLTQLPAARLSARALQIIAWCNPE
jgi:hypothetical protein